MAVDSVGSLVSRGFGSLKFVGTSLEWVARIFLQMIRFRFACDSLLIRFWFVSERWVATVVPNGSFLVRIRFGFRTEGSGMIMGNSGVHLACDGCKRLTILLSALSGEFVPVALLSRLARWQLDPETLCRATSFQRVDPAK